MKGTLVGFRRFALGLAWIIVAGVPTFISGQGLQNDRGSFHSDGNMTVSGVVTVYNIEFTTPGDATVDLSRPLGRAPANDLREIRRLEADAEGIPITLPSDIESMWAFYQDRDDLSPSGCRRALDLEPATLEEFVRNIGGLIRTANRDQDVDLIITAFSRTRRWDGAAREIRIDGRPLEDMARYWCNGEMNYGYRYVPR